MKIVEGIIRQISLLPDGRNFDWSSVRRRIPFDKLAFPYLSTFAGSVRMSTGLAHLGQTAVQGFALLCTVSELWLEACLIRGPSVLLSRRLSCRNSSRGHGLLNLQHPFWACVPSFKRSISSRMATQPQIGRFGERRFVFDPLLRRFVREGGGGANWRERICGWIFFPWKIARDWWYCWMGV